jgi:hypothetical protein
VAPGLTLCCAVRSSQSCTWCGVLFGSAGVIIEAERLQSTTVVGLAEDLA